MCSLFVNICEISFTVVFITDLFCVSSIGLIDSHIRQISIANHLNIPKGTGSVVKVLIKFVSKLTYLFDIRLRILEIKM